jgi:hypothetical protein
MNTRQVTPLVALLVALGSIPSLTAAEPPGGIPTGTRFACPMETHPDQPDASQQGPYFSPDPGDCPWCGMKLKPVEELPWVRTRQAAQGGQVAYTCPDHQHVLSQTSGECPRCGKALRPFKVMYTCPHPQHAGVIRTSPGRCPQCRSALAPFRGIWLDKDMAVANLPPTTQPAPSAAYHCPVHPLVGSDRPADCTICAAPLQPVGKASPNATQPVTPEAVAAAPAGIPPGAKYACPMQECRQFSAEPGNCPTCGMKLKAIESVTWARELTSAASATQPAAFLCPMHPKEARSDQPGICPICAMQLVPAARYREPAAAPDRVQLQLDHVTEHYLAIQRLLASDSTQDVARNALGMAAASEEMLKHVALLEVADRADIEKATRKLHAAALKLDGRQISQDRVNFIDLSEAMVSLLKRLRPDRQRWDKLYIYHCPMSKGDWIQSTPDMVNPYYGFKMLKCGELKATK